MTLALTAVLSAALFSQIPITIKVVDGTGRRAGNLVFVCEMVKKTYECPERRFAKVTDKNGSVTIMVTSFPVYLKVLAGRAQESDTRTITAADIKNGVYVWTHPPPQPRYGPWHDYMPRRFYRDVCWEQCNPCRVVQCCPTPPSTFRCDVPVADPAFAATGPAKTRVMSSQRRFNPIRDFTPEAIVTHQRLHNRSCNDGWVPVRNTIDDNGFPDIAIPAATVVHRRYAGNRPRERSNVLIAAE